MAPVVLGHAIDEGEADAAALGLGGEERLEDVGEIGIGDAVTRVADPELEAPGTLAGQKASPHAELAAVGHGLHGVDAEIPDGLAELLGIHAGGEALAVLADDLEGDGHGAVLDEEHDLLEEIGEVDLVPGHGRGPGILEKIPDDPVQTLRLP